MMFSNGFRAVLFTLFLSLAYYPVMAGTLTTWFSEDFSTFTGSGFSAMPAAGQLDSNRWRALGFSDGNGSFGGEHVGGDFARGSSTGAVTTGGTYAFNTGVSTILGVQPGGSDFTPGSFDLRLENNSGETIQAIDISYLIWVFNDQGRANSLNLAFSFDDVTYTPVPELDYVTPEAASPSPVSWFSVDRAVTLTGLGLAAGEFFYLRFLSDDVSGSGSRDELGIGDIQIDIVPPPSLVLDKTGPLTAMENDTLVYDLLVSNLTDEQTLTNVVLTDILPAGVTFVADTSGVTPTVPVAGTYEWVLGDLDAGESIGFEVTVTVNNNVAPIDLVNQAEVSADLNGKPVSDQAEWITGVFELVTIQDIQTVADPETSDASPLLGQTVFTAGILTAAPGEISGPGVAVIQNAQGGPFSGLVVDADFSSLTLARGDEIRVLGEVVESFGLTRLNASSVELVGSPGVPDAEILTTADLAEQSPAVSEQWEGVLIEFRDVEVTAELSFGEWQFDDGSGLARGDDEGSISIEPAVGDEYAFIRGIGWFSFSNYKLQPRNNADIDFVPEVFEISEIQGEGLRSPFAPASGNDPGQVVRTEDNIVTALASNGFFIQMPDERDSSNLPLASRGLFIFTGSEPTVMVGDRVNVNGPVVEFFDFTQIGNPDAIEILSGDNALPAPVIFDALTPSPDPETPSCGINNFECFEGMLVSVADGFITAPNQRFGSDPIAEPNITTNGQRALRGPGVEFPGLGEDCPSCPVWSGAPEVFEIDLDRLGLTNPTVAAGTRFTATGVIGFEFGDYELWPTEYTLIDIPELPIAVPASLPDELTIGSLNALDLFDTVQNGPRPIPACDAGFIAIDRQVPSPAEYDLKLTKLAQTIIQGLLLPDVLAMQEVESVTTLQDLSDRIAVLTDDGVVYSPYLEFGNDRGNINNGFLVNTARVAVDAVTQLGANECLSTDNTPLHDRPPLQLEARFVADGADWSFVVMNNHLRSLGSIDTSARTRLKRHEQAQSIAAKVQALQASDPLLPIVLVGDKNAFQFSDGYVDVVGLISGNANPDENFVNIENDGVPGFNSDNLVSPALISPLDSLPEEQRYSFIFQSVSQVLDHALLSQSANRYLSDFGYMRGNADYWLGFENDEASVARSSDHDGLVVILEPGRDIDTLFNDRFEAK